jgi:DNA invertase Pin-like site-specific DNA recombinase
VTDPQGARGFESGRNADPHPAGWLARDLLNTLDTVARTGAGFKSLASAWADTTTPHGRLMLTVLGGLADFERELIRARTGEGRARAEARGVHMGRPPKLTPHQQAEARQRRDSGETLTDIARTYGVATHHDSAAVRLPALAKGLSTSP